MAKPLTISVEAAWFARAILDRKNMRAYANVLRKLAAQEPVLATVAQDIDNILSVTKAR